MQPATARALYSSLLWALQPAYRAKLAWRGRTEPGYREAVGERFGHYRGPRPAGGMLWLHAVSLGETRAAAPLIDALRRERPGLRLLLTHGTATGRAAGRALLRAGDAQAWLPYDTAAATARFFTHWQPALGVLMETELWPNLVAAAQAAGVPVWQANARLSDRSLRRGERFAALLRPALVGLSGVIAQTEADAQRLRAAGAARVSVAGNLKFDLEPDAALLARGARWAAASARPVVLAASTREGEEAPLLAAWQAVAAPRPRLLLVPRHPQRFDEVAALVQRAGLSMARRSAWQAVEATPAAGSPAGAASSLDLPAMRLVTAGAARSAGVPGAATAAGTAGASAAASAGGVSLAARDPRDRARLPTDPTDHAEHADHADHTDQGDGPDDAALEADVWLGDTLGEMPAYYAAARVALLGGSFAPLGGQNLIEAAACGCPVVMGPHTFNFDEAARQAEATGAAERVADLEAGVARAVALAQDDAMRAGRAEAARAFAEAHRGAASRMATVLLDAMG